MESSLVGGGLGILKRSQVKGKPGASRFREGQSSRSHKWRGRWRKRMRILNVICYVPLHLFKPTYSTVPLLREKRGIVSMINGSNFKIKIVRF
jgi:hypothetical protein